ncbi:hypothetical protein EVAR_48585_1 [Eumeta japonica]|uniref:Uncharacterized protein n=1 Tax=Eumeta variegata TaxID=151549 RepID=A0A4C1XB78_EUMVA|nr:hypothetical protein EVAR_48585_1 [Eumeta japonica]
MDKLFNKQCSTIHLVQIAFVEDIVCTKTYFQRRQILPTKSKVIIIEAFAEPQSPDASCTRRYLWGRADARAQHLSIYALKVVGSRPPLD